MNHPLKSIFAFSLAVVSPFLSGLVFSGVVALDISASAQTVNSAPELVIAVNQDKKKSDQSKSDKTKSDQSKQEKTKSDQATKQRTESTPIDGKRRDEIMKFVSENHPEMVRVIDSLKQKNPEQYQQALHSIEKSIDRLGQLKSANDGNYEQFLEEWKLNSRFQLLSAQLALDDSPARRKQLEELIAQLLDRRISQSVSNRERVAERLQQIDDGLKKAREGRAKEIQRRMDDVIAAAEKVKAKRAQAELAKKEAEQQKSSVGKPSASKDSTNISAKEIEKATKPAEAPQKPEKK